MPSQSTHLYCLKCKSKTTNAGTLKHATASNGRHMVKCKCAKCGSTKCKFTK